MIRWISFLCLALFLTNSILAQEQDVFDLLNSRKFADYLYESRQFDLAADEYERVVFMAPSDSLSILKLLRAYRFEHDFQMGLRRAHDLLPNRERLEIDFLKEIYLLQARAQLHSKNIEMVSTHKTLSSQEKDELLLGAFMLKKDWAGASEFYQKHLHESQSYSQLGDILMQRQQLKKKNKYLSAGLSTIVPGLGKVYTGDWQDGLIAFAFVASNAWQAYRGFKENGVKSTYGWIFGSIGAGFYLGNIYGSFKSAKDYNKRVEKAYYDQASGLIYSTF